MSFVTEWKAVMEGDASINSAITGGIKLGHLPDNFDITKKWIAWYYSKSENVGTLGDTSAYVNYEVYVTITDTDTVSLDSISDDVVNYLVNLQPVGNIVMANFNSEAKLILLQKAQNTYQNTMSFIVTFLN